MVDLANDENQFGSLHSFVVLFPPHMIWIETKHLAKENITSSCGTFHGTLLVRNYLKDCYWMWFDL